MKNKLIGFIAILAIIAIIACKEDDPPQKQPDTPRTLTFGENTYTVTISSNDKFTAVEWTTLCDDVKSALETAYENGNGATKNRFRNSFGQDGGVTIVLEKNPTDYTNYKVGAGFNVLYLNVNKIATANYAYAVAAMNAKDPYDPAMKG